MEGQLELDLDLERNYTHLVASQMIQPAEDDATHNGVFAIAQYNWWQKGKDSRSKDFVVMYSTAKEYFQNLLNKYCREKRIFIEKESQAEKVEDMCAWFFEQAIKKPIDKLSAYGYFAFLKIMHDKKTVDYESHIILETDYNKEGNQWQ